MPLSELSYASNTYMIPVLLCKYLENGVYAERYDTLYTTTPNTSRTIQEGVLTWQTKVASWVLPFLQGYAVPDNATVTSSVEFGNLTSATGKRTLQGINLTAEYPGLIPDISVSPIITPTNGGMQYVINLRKGVGFYGIVTEVASFDEKRVNKWTFPLIRRNFGHLSMSRGIIVGESNSIHYQKQYHFCASALALVSNYDVQYSGDSITNDADKFCLNRVDAFLYPEVVLEISFLPIWEGWAVKFFRQSNLTCGQKISAGWSGPVGVDLGVPGNLVYRQGNYTVRSGNETVVWELSCLRSDADPVWKKLDWVG